MMCYCVKFGIQCSCDVNDSTTSCSRTMKKDNRLPPPKKEAFVYSHSYYAGQKVE